MTTDTTPRTERPRARTKTMGASLAGHGLGIGTNAALWAAGTYGWGPAVAVGGATAAAAGVRAVRHRRTRRNRGLGNATPSGSRRRGLLGSLGASSRRGAGARGIGLAGGRPAGTRGRSGTGGFVGRLAGGRSTTPKRGGGIPGRGTTPARSRNPLAGGRTGKRPLLPGSGRRSGPAAGSRRRPGTPLPGSQSGRRGLFGRRPNAAPKPRTRGNNRDRGRDRNKNRGGSGSRWAALFNPFKNSREKRPGWGQGVEWRDGSAHKRPNQPQTRKEEQPVGAHSKNTQTPTPTRKSSGGAPPMPTRGGSGGRGGGPITQAAEQLAGTMSKPSQPINTLKGMDRNLGDLASALGAIAGGLKHAGNVQAEAMPDERAAHEQMALLAKQAEQLAQQAQQLQADQKRRNRMDHERMDAPRRNESGYDYGANKE